MSEGEQVFSPDGSEYLGTMHYADDGCVVLVSDAGEILSALDPDGNPADPADFTVEGDGGEYFGTQPDDADALRVEVEALRADMEADARRQQYFTPSGQPDDEAILRSLDHQRNRMEALLGRELTMREQRDIVTRAFEETMVGEAPDLFEAANQLADEGKPAVIDTSSGHEARTKFMTELVEEAGPDAPDPLTGQPARVEPASDAPHDQRVASMMNSIHGHEDVAEGNDEGME